MSLHDGGISMKLTLGVLLVSFFVLSNHLKANATTLDWKGLYRFEVVEIDNPALSSAKPRKSYTLHHLILQPHIVASDGLNIHTKFHVLNNSHHDGRYLNSQLGDYMGNVPAPSSDTSDSIDSSVLSENQPSDTLRISEAYLSWDLEFSSLIIGRAPVEFGLGMTYSAGRNLFDHWYDTSDLIAYKMVSGNFEITPMMGKSSENNIGIEDDVTDYNLIFNYKNPETGLSMGLFYQSRVATASGNTAPKDSLKGNTLSGKWNSQNINIFVGKKTERINFGVEAGFLQGKTGVQTNQSSVVGLDGRGLALELEYHNPQSKWVYGLNAGFATGDNPNTDKIYEGYYFDRNYDVAFLLFNHPLGQADFLSTTLLDSKSHDANAGQKPDVEAISNVTYFSPYLKYKSSDKLFYHGRLTFGVLNEDPLSTDIDKNLGYELDFTLDYRPYKNFIWLTEVGLLFPGNAFAGGTNNFSKNFCYGLTTKAAITF